MRDPSPRDYWLVAAVAVLLAARSWFSPPSAYPLWIALGLPALVLAMSLHRWRESSTFSVSAAVLVIVSATAGRLGVPWLMLLTGFIVGAVLAWAGWQRAARGERMKELGRAALVVAACAAILLAPLVLLE
jgi:hypothetical protein